MSQETANQKAVEGTVKFFASVIIVAAIVYSEILFLGIVQGLFPPGPLAIGAMVGAITTGLSILALCLAKSHWFRPGQQLVIAWIFTVVEIAVLIMNDILAYQLHAGTQVCLQTGPHGCLQMGVQLDSFTTMWRTFCVAAPALSLVGWILLFYFDSQRAIQHKRLEMLDNQQRSVIDFEAKMHKKIMEVQNTAGDMVASRLAQKIETQMEYQLDEAAARFTARVASQLIGEPVAHSNFLTGVTPKQLPSRVVDANPVKEQEENEALTEASSTVHVVDPHGVKKQVDEDKTERKPISRMLKDAISFKLPTDEKKIETEAEKEEIIEDDDEKVYEVLDPQKKSPSKWTDQEWVALYEKIDAFAFNDIWRMYKGDVPYPWEKSVPTKKSASKKKTGKVTRREVLGMENPEG